jgi:FKBP-type peptidyl-prolyl cis-trans isomerase SlyD
MTIKEKNSVVGLSYDLREVGSDTIIDSNRSGYPLEFITGMGQLIPGLEKQLVGMKEGDSAQIKVEAKDAYGEIDPDAFNTLPIEQFEGIDLHEGMTLYGQSPDGGQMQVTVKSFNDKEVTIDYNHPLAGKDLIFDVDITQVRDATSDEIATGVVGGLSNCYSGG